MDLRKYPVQPQPCYTCPFAGKNPLPLLPEEYAKYIDNLNCKGQHLCHSVDKMICRGGRQIQLTILCAKGFLPEPTDEAFNAAFLAAMKKKSGE